jgi:hypothetical protein
MTVLPLPRDSMSFSVQSTALQTIQNCHTPVDFQLYSAFSIKHSFDWNYLTVCTNLPCCCTYIVNNNWWYTHRLSFKTPTTRRKEKSPSDGHCQCEIEMDDHLLACQLFLEESHIVTYLAKERTSFLTINYINDISFFGTFDCHYCCSIA